MYFLYYPGVVTFNMHHICNPSNKKFSPVRGHYQHVKKNIFAHQTPKIPPTLRCDLNIKSTDDVIKIINLIYWKSCSIFAVTKDDKQ